MGGGPHFVNRPIPGLEDRGEISHSHSQSLWQAKRNNYIANYYLSLLHTGKLSNEALELTVSGFGVSMEGIWEALATMQISKNDDGFAAAEKKCAEYNLAIQAKKQELAMKLWVELEGLREVCDSNREKLRARGEPGEGADEGMGLDDDYVDVSKDLLAQDEKANLEHDGWDVLEAE